MYNSNLYPILIRLTKFPKKLTSRLYNLNKSYYLQTDILVNIKNYKIENYVNFIIHQFNLKINFKFHGIQVSFFYKKKKLFKFEHIGKGNFIQDMIKLEKLTS